MRSGSCRSSRSAADPALDPVRLELELIRKCLVKVPPRLGRPLLCEPPLAMSPPGATAHGQATEALLALTELQVLQGGGSGVAVHADGDGGDALDVDGGDDEVVEEEEEEARPVKRGRRTTAPKSYRALAAGLQEEEPPPVAPKQPAVVQPAHPPRELGADDPLVRIARDGAWWSTGFVASQLCANGTGEPLALHPVTLGVLRRVEEEEAAEVAEAEAAARRKAEASAAAKADAGKKPPAAPGVKKIAAPSGPSLRGKSIEEVEATLLDRLSIYVKYVNGIFCLSFCVSWGCVWLLTWSRLKVLCLYRPSEQSIYCVYSRLPTFRLSSFQQPGRGVASRVACQGLHPSKWRQRRRHRRVLLRPHWSAPQEYDQGGRGHRVGHDAVCATTVKSGTQSRCCCRRCCCAQIPRGGSCRQRRRKRWAGRCWGGSSAPFACTSPRPCPCSRGECRSRRGCPCIPPPPSESTNARREALLTLPSSRPLRCLPHLQLAALLQRGVRVCPT